MRDALVHRVLAAYRLRYHPVPMYLFQVRQAKTPSEILSGINPDIIERAEDVTLVNVAHNQLIKQLEYKVRGNTRSQYTVMIRAVPEGDERQYWKSDVLVSCSCRYWRYGGCEHHAYEGDYLYSRENPLGTVAVPSIRDPEGNNYVCKHVYKALQEAKGTYFDLGR